MILSYGLGFFTNFIVKNIKELDDIVERNKREEEVLAKNFKQSIDSLSIGLKPASLKPANLNNIKSTLKK
jgi:hypothetical protein